MKKCLFALGLALLFLLIPGTASAEDPEGDFSELYDALMEESGAEGLFSLLPEDSRELLRENGVTGVNPGEILSLDFWDILRYGWTGVKSAAREPLSLLALSVGVILLCALLDSLKSSFAPESHGRVFSAVSVLCVGAAVVGPISKAILQTAQLLKEMSGFLLSFVPIYTGIVSASGKAVSASAYNACLVGAAQVISRLSATVLAPLLGVYMAFCLIGAASEEMDMQGIAKGIKSVVMSVLTLLLTVFTGLLGVQGTVAAAADSVTAKTLKFAIGSFVPVVGGALSDAYSTIQGCMGVIRSAVGGFGLLAIAAAFLPPVVSLLLMQLALAAAGAVGELLGVKQVGGMLKSAASVLSLLLSLLLVFAMLFIVSVSLMMALTAGAA